MKKTKQFSIWLRRWTWLILLGLALGMGGGYVLSQYQTPVYQASTEVLIMRAPEDIASSLSAPSDQQLARTFAGMIVTRPLLEAASQRLGYPVESEQISVDVGQEAQFTQVSVEDNDPQRSADIANTLVDVFLETNEELQASRFASSEESLQAQLQQVEDQINGLQEQLMQISGQNLESKIEDVTDIIADLQTEILNLQEEIVLLENSAEPITIIDDESGTIVITPTPPLEQQIELVTKKGRLSELQSLLNMYQRIYVDLSFSGDNTQNADSRSAGQIQSALTLYEQIYSNLLSNYEAVRLTRFKSTPNIIIAEEAVPPSSPIRPDQSTNIALGGLLGLVTFGGISLLIENLDDTLRSPQDVARHLELPVLGTIGKIQRRKKKDSPMPFVVEQPRSPVAEAFRSLRTNLEFAELDNPLKLILMGSPDTSAGKTTVAVNLATVMAQAGKRVVLLDADLRRPKIHRLLGMQNSTGLSDILRDDMDLDTAAQNWKYDNLLVITSGNLPPNPAEVLSSEKMAQFLQNIKQDADVVIVDGPPFILADASALSARVDGVLVVIQMKQTQAAEAIDALEQLERVGARILGVVLNRVEVKDTEYYYKSLKEYSSFSYDYPN